MSDLPLDPKSLKDVKQGIVRNYNPSLSPADSVNFSLNANFDVMGAIQGRLGIELVGSPVSGTDTTTDKVPDADPETSGVDGWVSRASSLTAYDTFDTDVIDTAKWTSSGNIAQTGGKLVLYASNYSLYDACTSGTLNTGLWTIAGIYHINASGYLVGSGSDDNEAVNSDSGDLKSIQTSAVGWKVDYNVTHGNNNQGTSGRLELVNSDGTKAISLRFWGEQRHDDNFHYFSLETTGFGGASVAEASLPYTNGTFQVSQVGSNIEVYYGGVLRKTIVGYTLGEMKLRALAYSGSKTKVRISNAYRYIGVTTSADTGGKTNGDSLTSVQWNHTYTGDIHADGGSLYGELSNGTDYIRIANSLADGSINIVTAGSYGSSTTNVAGVVSGTMNIQQVGSDIQVSIDGVIKKTISNKSVASGSDFRLYVAVTNPSSSQNLTVDNVYTGVAVSESFASIISGAGSVASDNGATGKAIALIASTTTDQFVELRRGQFVFDITSIPSNAIITSATFKAYVTAKVETIASQSMSLVGTETGSNAAIIQNDFSLVQSTKLATDKTLAGLTTSAYNTYTLNADGLAYLQSKVGTSTAKLALRLASDVAGTAPTWGSGNEASVTIDFADNASNEPTLSITYRIGTTILGLHYHDDSAGTYSQLIVNSAGTLNYLDGSNAWQAITSGTRTNGLKDRFLDALGYAFVINKTDGLKSWNGNPASALGTTNCTSAPVGYFLEWYKQKMYIFGNDTNPDRLFSSSIPNTSYAITWDPTNDWIDIHPKDGENATGMRRYGTELLLFKKSHMYRYFGVAGTDPDPIVNDGTLSNESIVPTDYGCFFHSPKHKAFMVYSGGIVKQADLAIADLTKLIPRANYPDIAGWEDDGALYMSVGDIVVNGITIVNAVFRMRLSTNVWALYSYPTRIMRAVLRDTSTEMITVVGDNNSSVYNFNSGNDDAGNPISYGVVYQWIDFGFQSYEKTINELSAFCERASGMKISWQSEDDNKDEWHPIMSLADYVTTSSKNLSMKGHRIRFRLHGTYSGTPWLFEGIEIIKGIMRVLPLK